MRLDGDEVSHPLPRPGERGLHRQRAVEADGGVRQPVRRAIPPVRVHGRERPDGAPRLLRRTASDLVALRQPTEVFEQQDEVVLRIDLSDVGPGRAQRRTRCKVAIEAHLALVPPLEPRDAPRRLARELGDQGRRHADAGEAESVGLCVDAAAVGDRFDLDGVDSSAEDSAEPVAIGLLRAARNLIHRSPPGGLRDERFEDGSGCEQCFVLAEPADELKPHRQSLDEPRREAHGGHTGLRPG